MECYYKAAEHGNTQIKTVFKYNTSIKVPNVVTFHRCPRLWANYELQWLLFKYAFVASLSLPHSCHFSVVRSESVLILFLLRVKSEDWLSHTRVASIFKADSVCRLNLSVLCAGLLYYFSTVTANEANILFSLPKQLFLCQLTVISTIIYNIM